MGISVPFRINGGLNLDGKVQFKVFLTAPAGATADSLAVGSLVIAQDSGKWYRKTTIGSGPDKWSELVTNATLLGIAPSWRQPVTAVETRSMTTAEAKDWVNKRAHAGGTELTSNLKRRILFTNITDNANGGVYEVTHFPQARVVIADAGWRYELRSTLPMTADTTAGNSLTLTMTINNPANATATTCVITGNNIVVNLKNDGTDSTALVSEVQAAIEAVDTDNKVYIYSPNVDPEEFVDDTFTIVQPMALTSFSGGTNGNNDANETVWVLGTVGNGKLTVRSDEDGDWNDFRCQTRTDSSTLQTQVQREAGVRGTSDSLVNAKADMDSDNLFDGVAVVSGLRVFLYLSSPGGPDGIYLVSGSSGSWTLTLEQANQLGDVIHVTGGTSADTYWAYNPTEFSSWDSTTAPAAMTMDSNATTYVSVDEVNKTITIHLGNNGTAITATVGNVDDALDSNTFSAFYNQQYDDQVFSLKSWESDDSNTVITSTNAVFGTGGVGADWGFEGEALRKDAGGNFNFRVPGDTIYVEEGFNAGSVWTLNSSYQWVKQGASSTQEMGYVQTFIGKSGDGNELPNYSSTDVITQGANLEAAIGDLDEEAGDTMAFIGKSEGNAMPTYTSATVVTQSGSLEAAVGELDAATGKVLGFIGSAEGDTSPTYTSTDIVTQSNSLEAAIGELDAAGGDMLAFMGAAEGDTAPTYGTTNAVTQSATLEAGISQLDLEVGYVMAFLGKAKGNEAPAYTTVKVVSQGSSLETAVSALDDLLGAAKKESTANAVTTQVVADSIIMEQELAAEWMIHVREVANPNNVYFTKVTASHNAAVALAATTADFTESAILEMGSPITGLTIGMDMEVAGALNVRTMRLLIASTDAVDVTMTREVLRAA